jgi:two-component system LytT family response regulator
MEQVGERLNHRLLNLNSIYMNWPKILTGVQLSSVQYLQAESNYTSLYFKEGSKLISGYSLNVFAGLFNERHFIRIDRSHLVNRGFISRIYERQKGVYVQLKNNTELLVPRRRKTELLNQYPNLFINQNSN